jgi:hypothetical protein
VRHLGLLLVGTARITRRQTVAEPHRGSRGVETDPARRRVVELSGADSTMLNPVPLSRLVDLDGLVLRVPPGVAGRTTCCWPAASPSSPA